MKKVIFSSTYCNNSLKRFLQYDFSLISCFAGKAFGVTDFINPNECSEPVHQVVSDSYNLNLYAFFYVLKLKRQTFRFFMTVPCLVLEAINCLM